MKDDDYVKFCLKCGWNDSDVGCTSPQGEDVFQCELYRHYHPEEVEEFESMIGRKESDKSYA